MILIGLGANLPSRAGPPAATLEAALAALERRGIRILRRSGLWESAPVPASDQPWFVNAAAALATGLGPEELLRELHAVEAEFGRIRHGANAARSLDLDLLAHGVEMRQTDGGLILPHPRLAERAFVLLPLREIAPEWRHPVSGRSLAQMIAALAPGQACRRHWTGC